MAARRIFPSQTMLDHSRTHLNPSKTTVISSLRAPVICIEDHTSDVLTCDFHPTGKFLLSANRSGEILVGDIHGSFEKTLVMKGHQGAVMEAHFSKDGFNVYSCSADGSLGVWDTFRGFRKARLEAHTAAVNSVQSANVGYPVLCSGSNDRTVRIWDAREKECTLTLQSGAVVTATCFNGAGGCVISGGVDEIIKIWDLRMRKVVCMLRGHKGKITGISLSPCGSYILSHSVDNTLRVWDIRPEVRSKRRVSRFPSHQHEGNGLLRCAWSPDGTMISAGTAGSNLYIWDSKTGETLYELPVHESTVNDVTFHPNEPIMLSASDDKYLILHDMKES